STKPRHEHCPGSASTLATHDSRKDPAAMRRRLVLPLLALLLAPPLVSGCGRDNPMAPNGAEMRQATAPAAGSLTDPFESPERDPDGSGGGGPALIPPENPPIPMGG